jgi:LPS sulfotransferase NodH
MTGRREAGPAHADGWIVPDIACYTIAFTLRSGSNVLCEYLTANGIGQPAEYFQHPLGVANIAYYRELGVAPDDFKTFITRLPTVKSANGIFGAKVTWDHKNVLVDAVRRHVGRDDGPAALSPRHRWIYLRRRDRIAQAISLVRAFDSGIWTSDASRPESCELEYDFFRVLSVLQSLLTEEYLWEDFFEQRGIEPVRVFYEALAREPAATVFRVAQAVRRPPRPGRLVQSDIALRTGLVVQRDRARGARRECARSRPTGVTDYWRPRAEQLSRWLGFFREKAGRVSVLRRRAKTREEGAKTASGTKWAPRRRPPRRRALRGTLVTQEVDERGAKSAGVSATTTPLSAGSLAAPARVATTGRPWQSASTVFTWIPVVAGTGFTTIRRTCIPRRATDDPAHRHTRRRVAHLLGDRPTDDELGGRYVGAHEWPHLLQQPAETAHVQAVVRRDEEEPRAGRLRERRGTESAACGTTSTVRPGTSSRRTAASPSSIARTSSARSRPRRLVARSVKPARRSPAAA